VTTLGRRGPWLTALFVLVAVGLGSRCAFEFDRAALARGEWWRLLSCHFVHYGRAHAIGDILGFAGWAAMIEATSRRLLLAGIATSALLVGLGVFSFCPNVTHYAGLSGIDVALATMLLCLLIASPRFRKLPGARVLIGVVAGGHITKLGYELAAGRAILAPDLGHDVRLLPAAHVLGTIAGVLAFALARKNEPARARPRAAKKTEHFATTSRQIPTSVP
jgi:rhomboid family GlyGly-CTERM serine protease